jgi:hypothetical protein
LATKNAIGKGAADFSAGSDGLVWNGSVANSRPGGVVDSDRKGGRCQSGDDCAHPALAIAVALKQVARTA